MKNRTYIFLTGIALCVVAFYTANTGKLFGVFINHLAPCVQNPENSFPCYGVYDIALMAIAVTLGLVLLALLFRGLYAYRDLRSVGKDLLTGSIAAVAILACAAVLVFGIYAAWYSYSRHEKLVEAEMCNNELANPTKPTMVKGPDGSPAPLYSINGCITVVVPPSLWNLLRGRMVFENMPNRMKVNSYSFTDIMLGRYTFGPADVGCDQSATTTDCASLPAPSQVESTQYIPPNPEQPSNTWVSATGTPIPLSGFSFELPSGWNGTVYSSVYQGTVHVLVQKKLNEGGFTIDCPPSGKGLESATRLTSEDRSFISGDGTSYSIVFEKWTAPGNDPWYFIWVRTSQSGDSLSGSSGTYCLAQGSVTADIEDAMRTMYESWK